MNLKQKIMMAITGGHNAFRTMQKFEWQLKYDALIDKALNCENLGVSKEKLCEEELIVSLTTYGKRFYHVAATIESIMQGTVKPNRIILWLGEELKEKPLPIPLQKQIKRGLEIEYVKDIRSYKKLIPCLKKYPEACIITIDDDLIYDYDLVERLVKAHKKYPKNIVANCIDRIELNKDGKPVHCRKWKRFDPGDDSPLNAFVASCGVLYPPHCFHEEIFNESVFLDICKYADDVWFHAMALMNGTIARKICTRDVKGHDFAENRNVQDVSLVRINHDPKNYIHDIQFNAVFKKYDLYKKLK